MIWAAVLATGVGCLALKALGWSLPARVLDDDRVRRTSLLLPVPLLAALVAVQALADGQALQVDARLAGLGAAAVALALRAPFLLVLVVAGATAAGLRQAGWG